MSFWDKINRNNNQTAETGHLNWELLNSESGLEAIKIKSVEKPQIIFKHSTRCSISAMAKRRLERTWDIDETKATIYYLDLIAYRSISNKVADDFGVTHQSPQILIIKNGQSIFDTSHNDIDTEVITEYL